MTKITAKNITNYLQINQTDLHSLLLKCKQLERINTHFLSLLEEPLRKACVVANTDNKRLVLLATNSSVATQLRLMKPDLLRRCKQNPLLERFNEIEYIIRPSTANKRLSNQTDKSMLPLSSETAALIKEMANTLSDPPLRAVMQRIAKRANTTPKTVKEE